MPIRGLGVSLQRPLTAKDIAEIEEGINRLIYALFPPSKDRQEVLEMNLPDKIEQYITIADYAEKQPELKDMGVGTGLREGLSNLLKAVNEYYYRRH
ncbi:MAG: hypothetical protein IT328_20230 [Caldilineaceae bacterium]|nr:hypothetical protein [Caldilineaceae bacterium]